MNKTNVVLLTDCLGNITGGAEKQIFELAKRLSKEQYKVFVASQEAQGTTSCQLIESIGCQLKVFRVRRIYGLSGLIEGIKFFFFLRRHAIDVLMTYHFGSDIWGSFWGHWAGVPLIISNRRDMGFWRNQFHIWAYRLINPWVHKIVCVSISIKAMVMQEEHVAEPKVEIIYNGVDFGPNNIDAAKKKASLGLKPEDLIVMHVANLRPVKGHRYLIEAFAKVAYADEHGQNGRHQARRLLVLVGKDELNGQMADLAVRLGVKDKVLFLGERQDVQELLMAADICVLPSLSEGMSNAILEYMTSGKPVIATNVGGNPELVVHGTTGLLVSKENSDQLALALEDLIKTEDKRLTFAQNGFLRAKGMFSMDTMLRRYEELFLGRRNKLNVLHLVSSGGLYGAERVILNLASLNSGITCWVGAIHNKHNPHLEIIQEAADRGLKTVVFDSKQKADLGSIVSIKRFLKANKIDIVHSHNYKSDMMGFLATMFSSVRWVATNHVWHGTSRKLRMYEALDGFVLKSAKRVFAVSDEIKDTLKAKGFKDRYVDVIHNGIDISQFGSGKARVNLRRGWQVADEDLLLAIIGRLAPEKGHRFLFEALRKVVVQDLHLKCLVVGDGPLRDTLEKIVVNFSLSDRVIFTGIRQDMADIYGACDILVNASLIEGLPMTILEAMASKLPVIASSVGAIGQVIKNQENGVLVQAADVDGLATAILDLLRNPKKREAYAQRAYQDVCAQFSDVLMGQQYRRAYNRVL